MMASKRNFCTSRTPRNPWDTDFPALCRARVEFHNVLLGPRSSLHHLRRGAGPLCSAASSVLQARSDPSTAFLSGVQQIAFPDRSPIRRDTAEVSRFSCLLFLMLYHGCWVL